MSCSKTQHSAFGETLILESSTLPLSNRAPQLSLILCLLFPLKNSEKIKQIHENVPLLATNILQWRTFLAHLSHYKAQGELFDRMFIIIHLSTVCL